jgi:DNA-binding response OmpR family regulator
LRDLQSDIAITLFSSPFRSEFFDFEKEASSQRTRHNWSDVGMVNFHRAKKRILFVEDHEDNWEIVAYSLKGYTLICANDFTEGLRLARLGDFDLFILDNYLPDGTGIGLCRRIREFDPYTPILFYSAAGYEPDIQEALRSGAQAYLVKPVNHDDLERMVARLTSRTVERDFEA